MAATDIRKVNKGKPYSNFFDPESCSLQPNNYFAMAKHKVFFQLPKRELGKTDLIFEVYSDDEKFGTITISKGGLEWYPSNAKKPFRLDWPQFDRAIKSHYGY